MSLLNGLAQAAQLAGAKRKLPADSEPDLIPLDPAQDSLYRSNIHSWAATPWPYSQPSMQRSTYHLQQPQTPQLSHTSQIPTTCCDRDKGLFNDLKSTLPPQSDVFTDSSASPSTERSFRAWRDSVSTATNTSYANSPDLNGSMHIPQFGQPYDFPSHHYSHHFTSLPENYPYAHNVHRGHALAGSLATTLAAGQSHLIHAGAQSIPLDCGEAILCDDPNCNDGIPCSGQHLPVCDKDGCDDAIPCPVSRLLMSESSYPGLAHDDRDCSTVSPDDGFCCSDKCPQETRCPSPCFEKACDMAPCGVDHMAQMPWDWTHECDSMNECMDGCMDPRHMFHNSTSLESDGTSWESNVREQLSQALRRDTLVEENPLSDAGLWKNAHRKVHQHDQHLHSRSHGCQNAITSHDHAHENSCSGLKHRHRSTRERRHSCKWVVHGDANSPDAEVCGLEFVDAKELQEHVVKHVEGLQREDDLFPCRWKGCKHRGCDGFLARPKLKRHLMVHTGATPYKCDEPGCHVEMKTKDALDKHKRTHTGAKPYLCTHPNCESRFATSTELKTHLIVHSGQKPHKCPRCGDCFADSSNLSKHKKVHEVPKFKCPDCDYKMKRWDQMRRHFKSQEHALHIVENKEAEAEYKRQMQEAFDKLTPEERMLPVSREGSLELKASLHGIPFLAQPKREEDY